MKIVHSTENRKLGYGVAATYSKVGDTCPTSCKLLKKGCYAKRSFSKIWSDRSKNCNDSFENIPRDIKLVRINVTGDLLKNKKVNRKAISEIKSFALSRPDTKVWCYTHAWRQIGKNPLSNIPNASMFASIDLFDSKEELDNEIKLALSLGYKYARIINSASEKLENETLCPFDLEKKNGKKLADIRISCSSCQLCFNTNKNIGFIKF